MRRVQTGEGLGKWPWKDGRGCWRREGFRALAGGGDGESAGVFKCFFMYLTSPDLSCGKQDL